MGGTKESRVQDNEERAQEKENMGVEGKKVKWLVVEEEGRERLHGK